jgi:transcriptional regulator with PAS, ATPase and Fis domain
MNQLIRYSFPGNIRELENIIERAVIFSDGKELTTKDLPLGIQDFHEEERSGEGLSMKEKVKGLEIREIRKALREYGGVKSRAARSLGVTERILSYKMKIYGIGDT